MVFQKILYRFVHIPYLLHIVRRGRRGPRVILLHGVASRGDVWDKIVEELSQTHRCVQVDLLGHGKSPKPDDIQYDTTDHVRSLRWTLFWKGIWGKKIIVTHSMGGLIALRYAADSPKKINHLILVALPIYKQQEKLEQSKKFEDLLDKGFLTFYRTLRALPKNTAIRSAQALVKALPQLYGNTTLDDATWYPAVSSLAHTIEQQTARQDFARLPKKLPITLIYGRLDQLVLAKNLRELQRSHSGTKLVSILTQHEMTPRAIAPIIKSVRSKKIF